ncbi:putative motility protein [Clostridium chromiireducens]|uniref:Motility protein n=1 Tax=Clostridium chromiireducens TaxID=225345 RepID=A0A964RIX5_9CLOT|nr:YjfB family protein [Clostridium chromiireducens]MVX62327.1 putative motility protein [Clostridium chromiireducens]
MDIAELSMVMSQSKAQTAANIAVTKMAIDANKENGTQMAEMIKNVAVDPNLGNYIDVSV